MDDIMRRNIARRRTTINRYVTDSNAFWREELHPRIANLQPQINNLCEDIIVEKITDNVWGFPVDEQSTSNTLDVFLHIINDYWAFVDGRRTWVYTETDGYWTEENIVRTLVYAFVMALWDIGKQMLVDNYPLVEDDLRHRSGITHSNDKRETYHDSASRLATGEEKYTERENERNKILESTDSTGSDTSNSRSTNNATTINDMYQSPQDQGVLPSKQSDRVMSHTPEFDRPEERGVAEVVPNGNPKFTTMTQNEFAGSTDTSAEGRTSTSRDAHARVDEKDNVNAHNVNTSELGAENNVGAKAENDTGIQRQETLDMSGVLQSFYDIFKDRLFMELDNRLLPYFLNMKISRFTDHATGRKEYV